VLLSSDCETDNGLVGVSVKADSVHIIAACCEIVRNSESVLGIPIAYDLAVQSFRSLDDCSTLKVQ